MSSRESVHGYQISRQIDSLLRPRDGMWRPNAGLLPVLRHVAQRQGNHIMVRQTVAIARLPSPDTDPRMNDGRIPDFVASNDRGVIRLGNRVEKADILAHLVAAYPGIRIAILGAHRAELVRCTGVLRQCFPGWRILDHLPIDEESAWVGLCTFFDAPDGPFEKCHLVVLLDATHATHVRAQIALSTMDARFCLFGLLRRNHYLAPSERDVLMATFGPAVLDVPWLGEELAEVVVVRIGVHAPPVHDNTSAKQLRRRGYWYHAARNRQIARLARALRANDRPELSSFRPLRAWLDDSPDRPQRVTILVQSVLHAVALARGLPGWPIWSCGLQDALPGGLDERDRRLLTDRRTPWITGEQQIVCQHVADHLPVASSDVVIWAGGGPHAPVLPWQWLRHSVGTNHRLLVVDFTDDHHPQLAEWSDQRLGEYAEREWFAPGIDGDTGRIMQFLRRRPSGRERRRNRSAR